MYNTPFQIDSLENAKKPNYRNETRNINDVLLFWTLISLYSLLFVVAALECVLISLILKDTKDHQDKELSQVEDQERPDTTEDAG